MIVYIERATKIRSMWLLLKFLKLVGLAGLVVVYISKEEVSFRIQMKKIVFHGLNRTSEQGHSNIFALDSSSSSLRPPWWFFVLGRAPATLRSIS